MRASFAALARHVRGKRVLDYGCGIGLSAVVQVESGAAHVTGVDLFEERIIEGRPFVASMGSVGIVFGWSTPPTRGSCRSLAARFEVVTCNAMLEHIPQPRDAWIREIWRMVAPGGMLIVNETPNKYLPWDFHTLGLPLTNWLPSPVARWIA
jgi:2-polyprenyl-3-methyl-5-hydroxy-6-metoxy-1,4-benzoquinol methylase